MNYRHAFHAGNFADVFKHLALVRALIALKRKETAFRFIDTHAGAGRYDLSGEEATRAGEWREGVARFDAARLSRAAEEFVQPYRTLLSDVRREQGGSVYPGSPLIAQRLMRAQDRLLLSEAHERTAERLRAAIGRDRRVKIMPQDGWMTLKAAIPPPERRGLALIDPAFESPDEFEAIARALPAAWRKWPTGTYMLWYPIKDVGAVERFMRAMQDSGIEKALRVELFVDDPVERGLNACGLLVINPPWMLADEFDIILPELAGALGRRAARWRSDWLAPERRSAPNDRPAGAGDARRTKQS